MNPTVTKNPVPTLLYDAADQLTAGAGTTALASALNEIARQYKSGQVELREVDALGWLDAAAKVSRALGLSDEASKLEEAFAALLDGGIIPSRRYFDWARAISVPASPEKAAVAAERPIRIDLNLTGLSIASMPTRVTTRKVERDKTGRITTTVEVEEDA